MLSATAEQLCEIVGGSQVASGERVVFEGVEFSSNEIRGGELFLALKGESTHGHKYVKDAYDRGASAFLIEDAEIARQLPEPERAVVVDDTLKAFWALASWWRRELNIPVIAVTGSVGKTTVKELLASILVQHSVGSYSLKSYNNHVGVPYSICRMKRNHSWAVLEMGMNHPGELRELAGLAEPDGAVITCVGPAHTEAFSGIEAIADAKCEILEGVKAGGFAVVNADDGYTLAALSRAKPDEGLKLCKFGTTQDSEFQILKIKTDGFEGIELEFELDGQKSKLKSSLLGEQSGYNLAAAICGAKLLIPDLTAEQIATGVSQARSPAMRLNIVEFPDGRKLIDDSYNSNPLSLKASLLFLNDLRKAGMKTVCLIGDMKELGNDSERYHAELADVVLETRPEFVITVGPEFKKQLASGKRSHSKVFNAASAEEAGSIASKIDFDVLLVKGSRAIELEKAIDRIQHSLNHRE